MVVDGKRHTLATLSPGKERRHPFERRLGGPQGLSGKVLKKYHQIYTYLDSFKAFL
jgi:hypothetical protein